MPPKTFMQQVKELWNILLYPRVVVALFGGMIGWDPLETKIHGSTCAESKKKGELMQLH